MITPWDNAWVPYYQQAFESRGHEFVCEGRVEELKEKPDLVLHGWTGQGPTIPGIRNIMFMRRYELFDNGISKVDWAGVSDLICVNSWIANVVGIAFRDKGVTTKVHTIYNGTDPQRWRFKDRKPGNKIGMACHIHPKKNLPLALQVMALLPEDYELHIAGALQDSCTAEYLNHVGKAMRRQVYLYGHVPSSELSFWWDQMNYCLSTSLSEGNPNNVIEAMAKGIKPVVHRWPGAEDQFPGYLFNTAKEAAGMILDGRYESEAYLRVVQSKFSLSNIERVVDLALA